MTVVSTSESVSLVPLDTLAMQDLLIIQAKVSAAHQMVLSNDVDSSADLVDVSQRTNTMTASISDVLMASRLVLYGLEKDHSLADPELKTRL